MKASWSVSPWKPGTGSELANTEKTQIYHQTTVPLKLQHTVHTASVKTVALDLLLTTGTTSRHRVHIYSHSTTSWVREGLKYTNTPQP